MAKVSTPYDELTYKIIGIAMAVHNELGPGLPEGIYKNAASLLMTEDKVSFEREMPVTICFRGHQIGTFKLDFVVEQKAVAEFKAVTSLAPIHEQQALTYLSASGLPVALLINFGAQRLEHKRLFPSKAVQSSLAYQSRQNQPK